MGTSRMPQATVVATEDCVSATLDGEEIMLHTESGVYYGVNPVGRRIWELVQSPTTVDEIYQRIAEEYDVSPDQCRDDVMDFLDDLAAADLVRIDADS